MWRGGANGRTSYTPLPRPRAAEAGPGHGGRAAERRRNIDARSSRRRRSAARDYIIRTLASFSGVHRRLLRPQRIELASRGNATSERMVTRAPVGLEVDSEFNRGRHKRSTSSNQYNGVAVETEQQRRSSFHSLGGASIKRRADFRTVSLGRSAETDFMMPLSWPIGAGRYRCCA